LFPGGAGGEGIGHRGPRPKNLAPST
jgi:hypothetical protein